MQWNVTTKSVTQKSSECTLVQENPKHSILTNSSPPFTTLRSRHKGGNPPGDQASDGEKGHAGGLNWFPCGIRRGWWCKELKCGEEEMRDTFNMWGVQFRMRFVKQNKEKRVVHIKLPSFRKTPNIQPWRILLLHLRRIHSLHYDRDQKEETHLAIKSWRRCTREEWIDWFTCAIRKRRMMTRSSNVEEKEDMRDIQHVRDGIQDAMWSKIRRRE